MESYNTLPLLFVQNIQNAAEEEEEEEEEAAETKEQEETQKELYTDTEMGWKSKVLPSFANVFGNSKKKTAAAEAVKCFDESKEEYGREFEEKKTELQAKVGEIYVSSPAPIKALLKKPTESGLKKNSSGVKKFLDELVKIEFPGSKPVSEAAVTFGSAYVAGPIAFIFEEVSSLLPAEEEPPAAPAEVIEETKEEEEEETTPPASATETPAPAESTTSEPPPATAEDAPAPAPEPAKA